MKPIFTLLLFLSGYSGFPKDTDQVDLLHQQSYAYLDSHRDSALALAVKAERLASATGYVWGEANSLYIQGYIYNLDNTSSSQALGCYLKAEYLLRSLKDEKSLKTRIDLLSSSGIILFNHYKYAQAIAFYEEALELAGDSRLKSEVCYRLGMTYRHSGDLNKAIEYTLEALSIALELGDGALILNRWNQLGLIYKDNKDYQAARVAYQQILDYDFRDLDPAKYIGRANHNMAITYFEEKDYEMAERHFLKALKAKEVHKIPKDLFITLMDLTELHIAGGAYNAAKEAGLRACQYYDQVSLKNEHFKIFNFLSRVHYALKEYEAAAACANRYVQESEKFDAEQEAVFRLQEQHKIDLVLANFYQEIAREEEASFHQKVILTLLVGFVLIVFTMVVARSVRKRILKTDLEQALRAIERESLM